MGYRERRAARAERLRGWAEKRDAKSAARFAGVREIADNIPLGQPILVGHHSEKRARRDQDRIHSGMRAAIDHADMAASMRSRADNIEAAAERAIYSDDADAIEKLRAKIEGLEAERARIVAYNKTARAAAKTGGDHGDLSLLTPSQVTDLAESMKYTPYNVGKGGTFPAYHLSNLGGLISKSRQRLAYLQRPVIG